jgi:hypothetical protein
MSVTNQSESDNVTCLEPPPQYLKLRSWHMLRKGDVEFPAEWCPSPHSGLQPLWIVDRIACTPEWAAKRHSWSYLGPCPTLKPVPSAVECDSNPDAIHPEYTRLLGDIEE